jgi:hypothetical protein
MSDSPQPTDNPEPAPLKHVDAERVTEDEVSEVPSSQDTEAADIDEDPAANPPPSPLRDVKGG